MFNKKICALTLVFLLSAMTATGCGSAKSSDLSGNAAESVGNNGSSGNLSIVCTAFPEYDWVREILGDHAESTDITYLPDNGTDLHSFQPTAEDMIKISDCDLFIHVGGESDEWVDNALEEAVNKDMTVIDMLDVLGDTAKAEELKDGMQEEEHDEDDEDEEETEYDEHVWLSLNNAKIICNEIKNSICEMDPENAADYEKNLSAYIEKLDTLDVQFRELADSAVSKTLVFCDRFPFRYFVDDYGFDYYAAFAGCSAETEASFETIAFLAGKINELGCGTVFTIENSDKSVAEAIINSTESKNQKIAELNSAQSVSRDSVNSGVTYISIMQDNYEVLKEALN